MSNEQDQSPNPGKPEQEQPQITQPQITQPQTAQSQTAQSQGGRLASYPPYERWDDWVEYDSRQWPRKVERRYSLVPTICFNCEAACGLLAYVDKETGEIQKLEGN